MVLLPSTLPYFLPRLLSPRTSILRRKPTPCTVCGHDGVRAYHNRVMTGPNKIVESFHCSLTVDELTLLYGADTGVCFGSSEEQFKLANGKRLNLKGRWSATLVKDDGRWLVANLHASTNLFDNVLLTVAKKAVWWAGIISLGLGLIVGVVVGRRAGGQPKRSR
jgi:ketosteroid isomerase-like protein